jgi:hypothetical protein
MYEIPHCILRLYHLLKFSMTRNKPYAALTVHAVSVNSAIEPGVVEGRQDEYAADIPALTRSLSTLVQMRAWRFGLLLAIWWRAASIDPNKRQEKGHERIMLAMILGMEVSCQIE